MSVIPMMSAQQKYALFNLVVALAAIVSYFVLLPILGPLRASGAFGLLGLCGLGAFSIHQKRRHGRVATDEREQLIWQRATLVAKSVIWVGLVVAFLVALRTFGDDGEISMRILALAIWWAFGVFLLVQSAMALILSARQ